MSPRVKTILEQAASDYGVSVEAILGSRGSAKVCKARRAAMRSIRALSRWNGTMGSSNRDPFSLPAIGRIFGRDHSTVWKACEGVKAPCERREAA